MTNDNLVPQTPLQQRTAEPSTWAGAGVAAFGLSQLAPFFSFSPEIGQAVDVMATAGAGVVAGGGSPLSMIFGLVSLVGGLLAIFKPEKGS